MLMPWIREWQDGIFLKKKHPGFIPILNKLPQDPFAISKRFYLKRGDSNIYRYGETPFRTLCRVAEQSEMEIEDVVVDLGAGRGVSAHFFHYLIGCQVIAVEQIKEFIPRGGDEIEWVYGNYLNGDLPQGTIYYLYAPDLEDKAICALGKKIPRGALVISISYPLSDYDRSFTLVSHFKADFPWGSTDGFIARKTVDHA